MTFGTHENDITTFGVRFICLEHLSHHLISIFRSLTSKTFTNTSKEILRSRFIFIFILKYTTHANTPAGTTVFGMGPAGTTGGVLLVIRIVITAFARAKLSPSPFPIAFANPGQSLPTNPLPIP